MKTSAWLLAGILAVAGGVSAAQAQTTTPSSEKAQDAQTEDIIIFQNGKQLTGKIVSETSSSVRFKGSSGGIDFETDYQKSEILLIKRGSAKADGASDAKAETKADEPRTPGATPATADESMAGKQKVYWIELTGEFGETISQTPIRNAIKDAQKNDADVIIFKLDALWSQDGKTPLPNDTANFDEIFRAEPIAEVFTQEIRREWKKQPRLVMWVKDAMGGAALLPFVCPEIYFHSEGRIGGLGNISFLFGNTGDDVVREKQRSLRMGHAEGWCIAGGYNPMLIRAMARVEFVMSVRWEDGKPVLFEGYPKNPGEELLTDSGMEGEGDSLQERVAGTGNDVLTLNERTARMIGVSKGTVDTQDELMAALGLERSGVLVPGRSKQIMKDWSDGLENSKKRLRRLIEDYQDVRVKDPGGYNERTAARGNRRRILEEIKSIINRWGEGITDRWRGENRIPPIDIIDTILEQIRLEQMQDQKR